MEREGFGIRLGAALIDVVILIVVMSILALLFGGSMMAAFGPSAQPGAGSQPGGTVAAAAGMGLVIALALVPVVYSLLEVFMAATPGKMALGLKIANQDGTPAPTGTLATRWAVKNANTLLGFLAAITGVAFLRTLGGLAGLAIFVGCFFTLGAARQAFHDMAAKTAVFRKGAALAQGFQVMPPGPPAA